MAARGGARVLAVGAQLKRAVGTQHKHKLHSNGALAEAKVDALEGLGFEWDADEAEWLRWFLDLAR